MVKHLREKDPWTPIQSRKRTEGQLYLIDVIVFSQVHNLIIQEYEDPGNLSDEEVSFSFTYAFLFQKSLLRENGFDPDCPPSDEVSNFHRCSFW